MKKETDIAKSHNAIPTAWDPLLVSGADFQYALHIWGYPMKLPTDANAYAIPNK